MASKVYECIAQIADIIIANKEFLTELDREIGDPGCDMVETAHKEGALLAVRHLLALGHRRIACLTDLPEISTAVKRRAGFVQAYAERGQRPDERLTISGLAQAPRVTVNGRRADVSGAAPDFQVALTP